MNEFNWASYWRNSLADAESGKGALKLKDTTGFTEVEKSIFAKGVLPNDIVKLLFKDENEKTQLVQLFYRPSVLKLKKQHGKEVAGIFPEVISPLICPLWLNRLGYLFPSGLPSVPRDLLSPQDEKKFTLGTVESLDNFLTAPSTKKSIKIFQESKVPIEIKDGQDDSIQKDWEAYHNHCRDLYYQVCIALKPGSGITDHYLKSKFVWLFKNQQISGTTKHILPLYDAITSRKPELPLFQSYVQRDIKTYRPCIDLTDSVAIRQGHSSHKYALADAQRDALTHAVSMEDGDILAVNGPPGTGKTTFVLSVVASLWVDAALKETDPPVIMAASTNNQAVTNIIDAFGKDFSEDEGILSGRWLPEISSYGAYFPRRSLEKNVQSSYQTKYFYERVEQKDYIERAESYFLDKAAIAFPELENNQLEAICEHLHTKLESYQSALFTIEKSWRDLQTVCNVVLNELGGDPDHTITKLSNNIQLNEDKVVKVSDDLNQWLNYLAQESIWLSLLRKRRRLKRRLYIENKLSSDSINLVSKVEYGKIEQKLTDWLSEQQKKIQNWHRDKKNKLKLINELREFESRWTNISSVLVEDSIQPPSLDVCDKAADTKIRFIMFRLAVHYWEGRWLLSCKEFGNEIVSQQRKTGPKAIKLRWRRRMMLTPCIVSTFHALPSHMICTPYNDKERSYDEEPLFNFIDLLIVDEAGQVSPEVAGASFSLAKKALVIGDIHQIEPVRTLKSAIDFGNLVAHNIIKNNNEEYEQVKQSGRSVVHGNVMCIAQSASFYHYKEEMEPGMFLLEHWRSYDEIISFCNDLCYKNALVAKRGCADEKSVYPPFGYLHIDGYAEQQPGGSNFNQLEAETIAAWLNENRKELELTFDAPLENVVGIVTPFKAQAYKIQQACNKYGIKTGKKLGELTLGTVHALQGAERNLVIFSPVYSRHNDRGFIDRTPSMLNVAVSRAKDSFMVFGDMDVISASPSSQPRGLLAKYLFSDKNNELVFSLQERSDLLLQCGKPRLINNADQHDAYLFELLSQVENNVYIVSPWVQLNKLKQTGLLEALVAACDRYVKINLYTDNHFNTTVSNKFNVNKEREFASCCKQLSTCGINVFVINGVHSKLVMADEKHMSVGSFNWFSAPRGGKYANMETSFIYSGDLNKEIKLQLKFLQNRGVNREYLAVRKNQLN